MDTYKEIALIPGNKPDDEGGAFDQSVMQAEGVDNYTLSQSLAKVLMPFAALLADGRGFGVIHRGGEDVSVVGLEPVTTKEQDQ